MENHRWISVLGSRMTVLDVKQHKIAENKKGIMRSIKNILRRMILPNSSTSLMITMVLPLTAVTHFV